MSPFQTWITVVSLTFAGLSLFWQSQNDSVPAPRSVAYGIRALPDVRPEDYPTLGVILLQIAVKY